MAGEKRRLLYDATVLAESYVKNGNRAGVYFVAKNLLAEFARQGVFEITLCVTSAAEKGFRALQKNDGLAASFPLITIFEKEYYYAVIRYLLFSLRSKKPLKEKAFIFAKIIYKALFMFACPGRKKNDGKAARYDLYFSPFSAIPAAVCRTKIPAYSVLHDTIPYKKNIEDIEPWFRLLLRGIEFAAACFCVSQSARSDFIKILNPRFDAGRLFVVYNSTAAFFTPRYDKEELRRVLAKYGVVYKPENKYVFSLCSIDPRKNLIFTIECFMKFIQKHSIKDLYIYLGGGRFKSFAAQFQKKLDSFNSELNRIIYLGYIDDEDVNTLYSNSLFFTFVSRYEGFGTPPLEAMQAGTPVITANNSSMPEVAGDAAIIVDCDDEEAVIKAMEDFYFNENLRKAYIEKGISRAALFSWEKGARAMTEIMND